MRRRPHTHIPSRKIIARPRKGNETIWKSLIAGKWGSQPSYSWWAFFVCPKMLYYSRETKGREIIARKEKKEKGDKEHV